MFGMGWFEIMIIMVITLVVLGPEKLPKMARTAGKVVRQLRRATSDLKQAIDLEGMREDMRLQLEDAKKRPDPYAGVQEEESSWAARRDEQVGEDDEPLDDDELIEDDGDFIPTHTHHSDLYSTPLGFEGSHAPPSDAAYHTRSPMLE